MNGIYLEANGPLGKNVTLPAITSSSIPAADCQKIAAAIGHPLPPTCGQIALFPASSLTGSQHAYRAFNRILLLLLILTPLAFIAALWASPRRRRTLLQLTIAGMLALIVVRRAMYWLESDLTATAKPANRTALSVITGQVLHGFFDATLWFLIGGLIVLAVVLLAGPSRWAAAARARGRRAASSAGQLVSAAGGHASSDATVTWVRRHLDLFRIGGAVIAALALLICRAGPADIQHQLGHPPHHRRPPGAVRVRISPAAPDTARRTASPCCQRPAVTGDTDIAGQDTTFLAWSKLPVVQTKTR